MTEAFPGNELPPESEQIRESFARFGRAMFYAQCVEKQLGILLGSTLQPNFLASTPDQRDAYFDVEFAKTLGPLIGALRSRGRVPDALEGRLRRALVVRNWLAHEYFWDRSVQGMSFAGREQMIRELDEAAEFLRSVDAELTFVSELWLARLGIGAEDIAAGVEAMRQESTDP